jgi:hypothetical protein
MKRDEIEFVQLVYLLILVIIIDDCSILIKKVQECDATMNHSSKSAELIKKILRALLYREDIITGLKKSQGYFSQSFFWIPAFVFYSIIVASHSCTEHIKSTFFISTFTAI